MMTSSERVLCALAGGMPDRVPVGELFERFFAPRYKLLADTIHEYDWHFILHSCGRINEFVPRLIQLGVDVLNMQQPRAYGLVEFGGQFKGQVCFLTTCDIQSTLPGGSEQVLSRRKEVQRRTIQARRSRNLALVRTTR